MFLPCVGHDRRQEHHYCARLRSRCRQGTVPCRRNGQHPQVRDDDSRGKILRCETTATYYFVHTYQSDMTVSSRLSLARALFVSLFIYGLTQIFPFIFGPMAFLLIFIMLDFH